MDDYTIQIFQRPVTYLYAQTFPPHPTLSHPQTMLFPEFEGPRLAPDSSCLTKQQNSVYVLNILLLITDGKARYSKVYGSNHNQCHLFLRECRTTFDLIVFKTC
jgi:hypothetical protein